MSEIKHEERVVRTTPEVTEANRVEDVTYDPYAQRRWAVYKAQEILYLIMVIVEGLIIIRFVLRLFAANPGAGFASFIYLLTWPLVAPFYGLFPTPAATNGSVLELSSLVALIVYPLVFWVIVRLIWLLFGETRTGLVSERVDTRRVDRPR